LRTTIEHAREHGLLDSEWERILEILGREPNFTELGIFSVMWSEHCSYKNSINVLKTFPRDGENLLVKAGEENAGLVDIGDGLAVSFKIESHNHPSAVEPYQSAATGVGGIMRDIFTMGARPIACLNSLRFGPLENDRNRFLFQQVVKGIADYGNCLGIPTVGGEVVFDECYAQNPLMNAMSVGIVDVDFTASAKAKGVGNTVLIVGSSTGRDGIHGATFASEELTEKSTERKSNVQVGDPFTEKLLLEACMEIVRHPYFVAMQDMGAAGIACSTTEMSGAAGTGMTVDLDKVPQRESNMTSYEIMLSESQERMLVIIQKGFETEAKAIFDKWDLRCEVVGDVTDTGNVEIFHSGKKVADIPSWDLVLGGGAPRYDREVKEPKYLEETQRFSMNDFPEPSNFNNVLKKIIGEPTIASKRWVFQQYDHTVRTNTTIGPGGDAAVMRIKNTNRALVMSTDGNGRYVYLNPRLGGQIAVAEAARNVVCSGGKPLAITNCLNFGNPYDPEIYYQFKEAVLGIGDACRVFDTPVTGGNVSFYNESPESAVYPTPVIGLIGLLDDVSNATTSFFKDAGDFILTIGAIQENFAGSQYLKTIFGKVQGDAPRINLEYEKSVQDATLMAIQRGIIKSAHDISDGGLAMNLAESCIGGKIGAQITISPTVRWDALLFGETQSVIVVTIAENNLLPLQQICNEHDVPLHTIGRVNGDVLSISDKINISIKDLEDIYESALPKYFV